MFKYHGRRQFNVMRKRDSTRIYSVPIISPENAEKHQMLKEELEKKKKELIIADLALRQFELANSQDSPPLIQDYNYGYVSKSTGVEVNTKSASGSAVPASALVLGISNFKKEADGFISTIRELFSYKKDAENTSNENVNALRQQLKHLKLSNNAIWDREKAREEVKAPWIIKAPYFVLCFLLDVLFDGKPISRFYFLETVARMPYFSYITMLHSYETLGWWRRSTGELERIAEQAS